MKDIMLQDAPQARGLRKRELMKPISINVENVETVLSLLADSASGNGMRVPVAMKKYIIHTPAFKSHKPVNMPRQGYNIASPFAAAIHPAKIPGYFRVESVGGVKSGDASFRLRQLNR